MTNFNHRVADKAFTPGLHLAIHRLATPITYIIPMGLTLLSFYSVITFFGEVYDIGSFTTALIPMTGEIMARVFNSEKELMWTTLVIFGYVLGPVSFYFFVYTVTKRHLPALTAGLWSMVPLVPFSTQPPVRVILALLESDGAHIMGLTLIPLISVAFIQYQRAGGRIELVVFAALVAIMTGISFFSLLVLAIFLFFISASEALISHGKVKIWRFFVGLLVMLVLMVVIYNKFLWSFLISGEGRATFGVLYNLIPMLFFIVPVLGTFAFLIFDRRPSLQPLFISLGLTIMFGLMHLVRTTFISVDLQSRFAAELSFAVPFLNGMVVMWLFDLLRAGKVINRLPGLYRYRGQLAYGMAAVLILTLVATGFLPRELY